MNISPFSMMRLMESEMVYPVGLAKADHRLLLDDLHRLVSVEILFS